MDPVPFATTKNIPDKMIRKKESTNSRYTMEYFLKVGSMVCLTFWALEVEVSFFRFQQLRGGVPFSLFSQNAKLPVDVLQITHHPKIQ